MAIQPQAISVGGYVDELKTNLIYCDSDGTVNPSGLYLKQSNSKYSVFQADKLKTSNNWYNSSGVPQVVAIADLNNVQDNVEFISKDPWQQLLYNREITNIADSLTLTELDKVGLYTGLYEKVIDSEGIQVVDSNGKPVVAPKLTTVVD